MEDNNYLPPNRKLTKRQQLQSLQNEGDRDYSELHQDLGPKVLPRAETPSVAYADDTERRIQALKRIGVTEDSKKEFQKQIEQKKQEEQQLHDDYDQILKERWAKEEAQPRPVRQPLPVQTPEERAAKIKQLLKLRGY